MANVDQKTPDEKTPAARRLALGIRRVLLPLATAVLLGISICEWFQPDAFAAVTAIPPFLWLIACAVIGLFGFARATRGEQFTALAFAILFTGFLVEQPWSLLRSAGDIVLNRDRIKALHSLRVVTLNCDVGNRAAAEEVVKFGPDVIFLQETPSESDVQQLAQSLFGKAGGVVWSPDCAIVARGKLQAAQSKASHFIQATLTLEDGQTIEVISLRLCAPVVRYDLWSPGCWTEHTAIRRKQRQEAIAIREAIASSPAARPIVIGGDCNAPAGDGALQTWQPGLGDAFLRAGRGWGGTVLNRLPLLRFDQLWCNAAVAVIAVSSVRTEHSDHRLVVGEFSVISQGE